MNKRIKYIIILLVAGIGFASIAAICNLFMERKNPLNQGESVFGRMLTVGAGKKEKEGAASLLRNGTSGEMACTEGAELTEKTSSSSALSSPSSGRGHFEDSGALPGDGEGGWDTPDTLLDQDIKALVEILQKRSPDEGEHGRALNLLLEKADKEDDRTFAFRILMEAKDALAGEELQTLLKRLHNFADMGGNEALAEIFFRTEGIMSPLERSRILSYIDGRHPLDERNTDRLGNAFLATEEKDLRHSLLNCLATGCGGHGISWISDLIGTEKEREEQRVLIDALSNSGSKQAFELLHELINREKDKERKGYLREAILRMKKDIPVQQ